MRILEISLSIYFEQENIFLLKVGCGVFCDLGVQFSYSFLM